MKEQKLCKKCHRDISNEPWYFPGCQYCPECVNVQVEEYNPAKHGKIVILITD